jgi:hypothetical protein
MKTTQDLAREAGIQVTYEYKDGDIEWCCFTKNLKAFEAIVRADEAEKYKWDVHSCGPTCTKVACVAMRKAVEAEREACAKVCENEWSTLLEKRYGEECADAIRARLEQPATKKSLAVAAQQESIYVKTFHGGKPWPLQPAPVQDKEKNT